MCIHVFMKRQQYYCYSCPAVVCHLMSCSFSFPHTTRLHVVLSMTLLLIWMLSWNLPLRFSWFFSPVLNGMTRIDERSSDDNSAMDTVVAKKSNGRVTVKELNRLISDVQEYPLEPNSNWYVSIFSVLRMSYTIYIMRVVGCCCSSRWVWNVSFLSFLLGIAEGHWKWMFLFVPLQIGRWATSVFTGDVPLQ